ncbi:MAG: ABC transporter ATP-binding protein, partial [Clostridiales bacterium]|nr:ABC transporter ATP-binding protein [Clostridiales bacterium]
MSGRIGFLKGLRLLKRTFGYMRGCRARYLWGTALSACELGMVFATPVLNRKLVEMVCGDAAGDALSAVLWLFGALLLAIPAVAVGGYWRQLGALQSGNNLRKAVFGHLSRLSMDTLARWKTGDLLTRLSSDAERAGAAFGSFGIVSLLRFAVVFPISLGMLLAISPPLAGLAIVYGIATLILSMLLNPYVKRLEQQARAQVSESANHLLEALRGMPIARVFLMRAMLSERYLAVCERILRKRVRFRTMNGISYGVIDFFSFSSQAVGFLVAILLLMPGRIDLAGAVYAASLMAVSGDAMLRLSTFLLLVQPFYVAQQRVFDILDLPAEPLSAAGAVAADHPEAIRIEDVCFAYGERPVLRGVSLRVRAGEHLAIVGSSGGGKTTLMRLLLGFHTPSSGGISLFGTPMARMNLEDIRALSAYVSQDCAIFDGSIGENIAYGRPNASQRDVEEAARKANLHDFIAALPRGY